MTELSQMFRWNANLVRTLAESVLVRARVIRNSLGPVLEPKIKVSAKAKTPRKKAVKSSSAGKKSSVRRAKRGSATKQ